MKALALFLESHLFQFRGWIIALFLGFSLLMAFFATQLQVDARFEKLLPMQHEYMQTFSQYKQEFGGGNRVVIALTVAEGDIFQPEFFHRLKAVTDELFFIRGIDRSQVRSLFTPNVRFTEVVEEGIAGGNVVPDRFNFQADELQQVRKNILKAGLLGRLVANDFSSALVSAELLDQAADAEQKIDLIAVAHRLEKIREKYQGEKNGLNISVQIIGFSKVMGDIADGAQRVLLFFALAFLITALLVIFYMQSLSLALAPLFCSLLAVVWQLGLLSLLGYGMDPMSILVPFLVFAIGASHGVQMVSAIRAEMVSGLDSLLAAKQGFRRLLLPGSVALLSDSFGFLVIAFIDIEIIQEMAVAAGIGVAMIVITNLFLLPLLLSYLRLPDNFQHKAERRRKKWQPIWNALAVFSQPKAAKITLFFAIILMFWGGWLASQVAVGDLHRGVPELRKESPYNLDTELITERFSIGMDRLTVIVETPAEGCVNPAVMRNIDQFVWHMENVEGVQSVISLSTVAKRINSGWNEGNLKWWLLPNDESLLAQAVAPIESSSGLLNRDCSVMPVYIFSEDHKASSINRIIAAVKAYRQLNSMPMMQFRLASGNLGVMAATNEEVESAQLPILLYIFAVIALLCLLSFRSWRATLAIILPLALVSTLAYALMSLLQIGLKVNTLPVVALGVGIGVDYGIYIYSSLQIHLRQGQALSQAYRLTLEQTGSGVLFTGITLAVGVLTWLLSPLQFQADMGLLLAFMFLFNMLAALVLLPALACCLQKCCAGSVAK